MKTKIVYVLVSNENDIYLEQAWVSMQSIRYHMENAHICLVVDSATAASFVGNRKEKAEFADEIIVVDLDKEIKPHKRSRILKTNVRNHVCGDYLFIDTDTIITKPLDEIDAVDADIAACWDSHSSFAENPYRDMCILHGKLLGWPIEEEPEYFNSGVMYVKDNERTRDFFKRWLQNYLEGYAKVGMDQPSFAKTNYEFNHIIKVLPDVWNCEFKHGIRFLNDAKIVHYVAAYKNDNSTKPFLLYEDDVFKQLKNTNVLSNNIKVLFDSPELGIPNLTLLLAGKDLYIFRDPVLRRVVAGFKKNDKTFKIISEVGKLCMLFERVTNKFKSLIP